MGLDDNPFAWTITKNGRMLVFRTGRQVASVTGVQADRLHPELVNSRRGLRYRRRADLVRSALTAENARVGTSRGFSAG
jgi:hypothetical protein